jgi:hypothetical protein
MNDLRAVRFTFTALRSGILRFAQDDSRVPGPGIGEASAHPDKPVGVSPGGTTEGACK